MKQERSQAQTLRMFTVTCHISGSLDTTFGTDGIVATSIGSGADYANAIAIQSDGKIVVAGYSSDATADIALAR